MIHVSLSTTQCWVALSQKPDIGHLQRRLYYQLTDTVLRQEENEDQQLKRIANAATTKNILVVIDGWCS